MARWMLSPRAYRISLHDLDKHKEKFDSMLSARDFSDMRAYIVTLKDVPEILCGGALYPECDFAAKTTSRLGRPGKDDAAGHVFTDHGGTGRRIRVCVG